MLTFSCVQLIFAPPQNIPLAHDRDLKGHTAKNEERMIQEIVSFLTSAYAPLISDWMVPLKIDTAFLSTELEMVGEF